MWSGLLVLRCMCMCVCVCVSMFIYAPWQCIHFLLGGEEQMNKQWAKEDRPGGFCVCVCVCLCAYTREWEVITKAYFMSCFGPPPEFALWFWVDVTPVDGWVVSAEMCSLPPARHINHCLPHWVTLHHANPSPRNSTTPCKETPNKVFPCPNFYILLW